jgi:sialidase-1
MDSRAHFTGAVDDVAVYDRALGDAEVEALRTGEAPVTRDTVTRLPMDRVRGSN